MLWDEGTIYFVTNSVIAESNTSMTLKKEVLI